MFNSISIRSLAVARLWLFSICGVNSVIANELTIPAPLQNDEMQTAPPYLPVTPQQMKVPVVSNWAEVNQRVHEIGGWMFYASEGAMDHEHHKQSKPLKPEQPEPKTNNHEGH